MAANPAVVFAAVVWFVVVDTSAGATLSLKLLHRYSDEARGIWKSRGIGNVSGDGSGGVGGLDSWPEKKSFGYFDLLLRNDLKKQQQRMGLRVAAGPQKKISQLLFPAHGSKTLFFGNELDWLHYAWIDVGTPSVSFLVALDAGSDLFWVPCDCIQCAPLSASYYSSLDRDLSQYSPSSSTTSGHLSCSHQLCELSSKCKNGKDPCPYVVNYDDVENKTSSSGFLVEDKLHLVSVGGQDSKRRAVQASVIMGCGRKQTGSYLNGAAPDGVMGLGPGNISVPSLLAKAGLVQNSFSLCFDANDSGRIIFGDQGHALQKSTQFLPVQGDYVAYVVEVESFCIATSCPKRSGFKAMVDSGASFTYLPTDVYNKIVSEFDTQVNATRVSFSGSPWDYCYNASSEEFQKIPAMRLLFAMNQSFVVHNPTFAVPQSKELISFCLNILPIDDNLGIIGQNYMTGYRMVFDMENLKLGWSNSSCKDISDSTEVNVASSPNAKSPTPLPTDEQRVPNARAISPAVAGRTIPKPSAASQHIPSPIHLISSLLLPLFMCPFVLDNYYFFFPSSLFSLVNPVNPC